MRYRYWSRRVRMPEAFGLVKRYRCYSATLCLLVTLMLFWYGPNMSKVEQFTRFECDPLHSTFESIEQLQEDCGRLFNGDSKMMKEMVKKSSGNELACAISPSAYLRRSCTSLWNVFMLDNSAFSEPERHVSIAFSILVNEDVWQFERLLRAIYRPHNFYCVHVDMLSHPEVIKAVQHIASCFENVIVPENRVIACQGCRGQLDAEMMCMEALLKASEKWSWFVNLHQWNFPIKTNWQLARILQLLNGTNSILSKPWTAEVPDVVIQPEVTEFVSKSNMVLSLGSTQILAVRGFVQFAVSDVRAQMFRQVLTYQVGAHSMFYSTLNNSPDLKIPGAARRTINGVPNFINLYSKIESDVCKTAKNLHSVRGCVSNVWLTSDLLNFSHSNLTYLFLNSVRSDTERYTLDCLERTLWQHVTRENVRFSANGEMAAVDTKFYQQYAKKFH